MSVLKIYKSKNLNIPFVILKGNTDAEDRYLCRNGVLFTRAEVREHSEDLGAWVNSEYDRRTLINELYDFDYAKDTGELRKRQMNGVAADASDYVQTLKHPTTDTAKSVVIMCIALALTSFGSMYISTVHTATYLFDYVDVISAWIMSAVITVYCSTAFEVVVLFRDRRRYLLSVIFAFLWVIVVTFSMITTVSIFYDKFSERRIADSTEQVALSYADSVELELLKSAEADLRDEIEFKKKDIEWRQANEYVTTAVRLELNELQVKLSENLNEQREVSERAIAGVAEERETLFTFFGRLLGIESGIIEFIMSTLSAVFINLISPMSVTVVVSLLGGMKKEE